MARKPLSGTVASTVLAYGTGAINVDACRIGTHAYTQDQWTQKGASRPTGSTYGQHRPSDTELPSGRWPANVILDETAAALLDAMSGERKSGVAVQRNGNGSPKHGMFAAGNGGGLLKHQAADIGYGDTGGASRFFFTANSDQKETA